MNAVPDFLNDQLKLYLQQAEQAESWKTDHEEAMHCRSIEDAIELGLAILGNIRRRNRNWARDVERGAAQVSWDVSKDLSDWYRWWKERSTILLRAIETSEAHGYSLDSASEFRRALADVELMALDTDRTKESVESLNSGRGISHAAAMNGLRNRLGTKST